MKKFYFFIFILFIDVVCAQKTSVTIADIDKKIDKAFDLINTGNPDKAIPLLYEIDKESESINYKLGIVKAGYALTLFYYNKADYNKVISLDNKFITAGKENNSYGYLSNIYRNKGNAYMELGFLDTSYKEFQQALIYAKKMKTDNHKHYALGLIYDNLAGYYARKKAPIDSVFAYMNKAIAEVEKIDDSNKRLQYAKYGLIAFEYMGFGVEYANLGKPEIAEDYFNKSLAIYNEGKYLSLVEETILLSELGRFHYQQKRYDEAVKYAEAGLEIEKNSSSPRIRRTLYETLSQSYMELNKIEDSKKYINLFTILNDSIAETDKKTINASVKSIASEQDQNYLSKIKRISIIYFISAIILIWIVARNIMVYWKRRYQTLKSKYNTLIANLESNDREEEENSTKNNIEDTSQKMVMITDETVNSLLEKLSKFEKQQKYIKQDMSLPTLAGHLNTNTKYLSKIIKQHKGKKFSDYINGLRIDYITEQLYKNPTYREYKTSYLAECSGFSSREVFTTVFKKETGVSPSYFIENLKKTQISQIPTD